ncbi:MAG: xanthine dehydrogenase family protein subunit M [Parvibaculaceae bacterium]
MKPCAFEYHAPSSIEDALELLRRFGGEARILAGGQSLVPAMNFRLARPAVLIDINGIDRLAGTSEANGSLLIGALTRHVAFERPVARGPVGRILPRLARHIAHFPIRTRGTFGGSLAHADPSAEWCTLALGLDAVVEARSAEGAREIAAADFFRSIFTTDLGEAEMLVRVRLPLLDESWRCGFVEFSRRAGDFAIVSAFAALKVENGVVREARLALGGVVDRPVRASDAEKALVGQPPQDGAFRASAAIAGESFEPMGDIHASEDYKKAIIPVIARRALEQAMAP